MPPMNDSVSDAVVPTNGFPEPSSAVPIASIARRSGVEALGHARGQRPEGQADLLHHFADKREVVFAGEGEACELIAAEIRAQPGSVDPLRAAAAGLRAASDALFEQHREDAVKLGRVIAESPELQERELVKRAVLAATIAAALRDRGTTDPAAVVTVWSAVAVFYVARNHWNQAGNRQPLAELIDETLEEFLGVTARPLPSA